MTWLLRILGLGSGVSIWAYVVVFGLGAAAGGVSTWRVMQWHVNEVVAQRNAAVQRAALAEQDASRWKAASDQRDVTIADLTAQLNDQSAEVEAGRARESALRVSLDAARAQNDVLERQADQLSRDLDAEQAKAPGDVREIGPIVAKRAPALFE